MNGWQSTVVTLALSVLLGLVTLTDGGQFRWQLVTLILCILLFGGWLLWRGGVRRVGWPVTGLEWAFGGAILASGLSLIASPDWRLGLARLIPLAGAAALFYLIVDWLDAGFPRRTLVHALVWVSGAALSLGCLEVYFHYTYVGHWRDLLTRPPYRLVSLLGHPNLMAGFVNLALPFLPILWQNDQRAWVRSGLLLWGLCYLFCLLFASSRGGLLGLATAVAVWGGGWVGQRGWSSTQRLGAGLRRHGWQVGGVLGLSAAILVGLFIYQSLHPVHGGLFDSRSYIWRLAAKVVAAHLWLGAGPGRLGLEIARLISAPPDYWPLHAHSLFWQVFGEFGVIGVMSLVGVIVCLAWVVKHSLRGAQGGAAYAPPACVSLLAFGMHQLVDDLTLAPAVLVALALVGALAVTSGPATIRRGRIPVLVMGVPLLLIGLLQAQWLWAYAVFDQARQAYGRGDPAQALALAQQAALRDPALPFYNVEAGLLAAEVGDWAAAEASFERALLREDGLAFIWANLGIARAHQADAGGAVEALNVAAGLAPRSPTILLAAGRVAEAAGQWPTAEAYYRIALNLRPDWADRPFWAESEERAKVREAALASASASSDPSLAVREALAAGRLAEAERLIAASLSNPDLPSYWRPGMLVLSGDMRWVEGEAQSAMRLYAEALAQLARPSIEGTGGKFWRTYGFWLYRREPAPVDSVPGLQPLDVTPDMLARFAQLAAWTKAGGDCAALQLINRQRLGLDPHALVFACP